MTRPQASNMERPEEVLRKMDPQTREEATQMAFGLALVRTLKAVTGMLARQAAIKQGVPADNAHELERAGIRIEYGEPVPDETIDPHTGATIYRRALVLIEDKYLYAETQLVFQPPRNSLFVRALVGHMDYADEIDPGRQLGVEWLVRKGDVDSGGKVF